MQRKIGIPFNINIVSLEVSFKCHHGAKKFHGHTSGTQISALVTMLIYGIC